jgi:hypothetical protein
VFRDACAGLGLDAGAAAYAEATVRLLLAHAGGLTPAADITGEQVASTQRFVRREVRPADPDAAFARTSALLAAWLGDERLRRHIGVHGWDGAEYFNKEAFERLVRQLTAAELVLLANEYPGMSKAAVVRLVQRARADADALIVRAVDAGYRVDRALAAADG